MTEAEYRSEFKLTKDTPYLTLMGELWNVYCEKLENRPGYKGITLYIVNFPILVLVYVECVVLEKVLMALCGKNLYLNFS